MTRNVVSTWPVEWSLVVIIGNICRRETPTDGDDDNEDEDDENQPDEPAVVREPDDE